MSNTTDTNQVSEDGELKDRLTKLISQDGWVDIQEVDVEGQVAAIQTIVRAEKLKLLAEVRERVMSEGDFVDAEILKKLYDRAYSRGYNDRGYENSYNSQDYRSAEVIAPVIAKIRGGHDKRSAALTKLEAEL